MSDIKYMSVQEFLDGGFLHEVNRQFFHPLGLALSVEDDGTSKYALGGIWDYREDPEGILFAPSELSWEKIEKVQRERDLHHQARIKEKDVDLTGIQWPKPIECPCECHRKEDEHCDKPDCCTSESVGFCEDCRFYGD